MQRGIVTARVLHFNAKKNGFLVVQRRKKKRAAEHHKLPGGKPLVLAVRNPINGKLRLVIEAPEVAARRELLEELGLGAIGLKKIGVHTVTSKEGIVEHHIIFEAPKVFGKPKVGREIESFDYYNPTKHHKKFKLANATKAAIDAYLNKMSKKQK